MLSVDHYTYERNSTPWSMLPVYEGSQTSGPPCPHQFSFRTQADLLIVEQKGAPADIEEVRHFQQSVQREMSRLRTGHVLFDNRETSAVSVEVSEALNEWVQDAELFKRVALLLNSELMVVSINMGALAKRIAVRAFDDQQSAVLWVSRR